MKDTCIFNHFLEQVDNHSLFTGRSAQEWRQMRKRLRRRLLQLLVDYRPELAASAGVHWPYQMLADRTVIFKNRLANGSVDERREALLFLALLPFPGQWRWLRRAEAQLPQALEIKKLLADEQQKIDRKIQKKRQKKFKLRHFCQILKPPRLPYEKGVLRIFSMPYAFVGRSLLQSVGKRYLLYIEPAAGVVFRHAWMRHFMHLPDPPIWGMYGEDAAFINAQSNAVAIELAHGDYLETAPQADKTMPPEYDFVFNATFDEMTRKRQELMLDMLCKPMLDHTNALFIGRGQAANVAQFRQMAAQRKFGNRVTVEANLLRADVPDRLSRCRVGVHIALHENGARCTYEYLRADLPIVVSAAMAGINWRIVNPETGIAALDADLPAALRHVLDHADQYAPRRWFNANSGSRRNSRKLNDMLKKICIQRGQAWETDIIDLGSSGASRCVCAEDYMRFIDQYQWLRTCLIDTGVPLRLERSVIG